MALANTAGSGRPMRPAFSTMDISSFAIKPMTTVSLM